VTTADNFFTKEIQSILNTTDNVVLQQETVIGIGNYDVTTKFATKPIVVVGHTQCANWDTATREKHCHQGILPGSSDSAVNKWQPKWPVTLTDSDGLGPGKN
jgi:hypothetical protein